MKNLRFFNGQQSTVNHLTGPRYTFAHEVGHVMGARHSRGFLTDYSDNTDVCAHAWSFNDENSDVQRTILAPTVATTINDPTARILHYSNPEVEYNGEPTGSVQDDNAIYIKSIACDVANHYKSGEMTVAIEGPSQFCQDGQGTYDAVVTPGEADAPGQPPYTYEWRWNTNGLFTQSNNFGTFLSNGTQVTVDALDCPNFFLFLQVSTNDGLHYTRVFEVKTNVCGLCEQDPQNPPGKDRSFNSQNENGKGQIINHGITLTPNPASNISQLSFFMPGAGTFSFTLTNAQGKIHYQTTPQTANSGEHQLDIPLTGMPSGVYFCILDRQGEKDVLKLIVE